MDPYMQVDRFMHGAAAVYYRELLILRRRITRLIPSWSVAPTLYLVAFGYAVGRHSAVDGHTYLEFLIPGLVAMSSMTQSFAVASEINIARFYWHIFEEIQAAPISAASYAAGEVAAGMTRALGAVAVILVLGLIFGVRICCGPWFWTAILLNALVFAALAVALAMLVKSHADQAMINSFVITPMAFLGGTVFPVDRLPAWAGKLVGLLPLTHAAHAIRSAAFGQVPAPADLAILAVTGAACFVLAVSCVRRAKD